MMEELQGVVDPSPAASDGLAHNDANYHLYADQKGGATERPTKTRSRRVSLLGIARSYSEQDEEEIDDAEFQVTTLELFSDLVVVVSIHVVSEGLEEKDWLTNLEWYFIHVFQLWLVWHVAMIGFHVSHLFMDHQNNRKLYVHYLVVLTFMTMTLLLAGAQAAHRHGAALVHFMVLRVFEVGVLWLQMQRSPPDNFDPLRLAVLKSIPTTMMPWVLFGEILPLTLSLLLSTDGGETPYLPLIFLSIFLIMAQRTYGAYQGDRMQRQQVMEDDEDCVTNIFDPSLLRERYELVTIIFIGEIAFGATAGLQLDELMFTLLAIPSVLSAFGCYLLCFGEQQTFWNSTGMRIIFGQHIYLGIFLASPGIAAGYLQIGEAIAERQEEGEGSCDLESSYLLCCSVPAFLVFSGLIQSINISHKDRKSDRFDKRVRYGLWLLSFLGAISMVVVNDERWMCLGPIPIVVFLCPFILILCSCVD